MNTLQTIILLMTLAIVLVGIALRLRIPYPLALVLGGAALGFAPGLNEIPFNPNFVLVIVLPPTLYYAAYSIPFKEFRRNIQDILWLALGLVIVTTLFIGLLFKWLFPELPWALAFTFGAIISPPDAVAATAILRRFTISSRLLTVLEGESLINDATGLVLYRIGVIALLSGIFSLTGASLEFTKVAVGGILIGMMTGYLLHAFSSRFLDPILAVVFSFTIPYLTYILADLLQVSGVLAVVINGLIGSRMMVTKFAALTRVIGWASWDILIILLNCFIFILIGLQLSGVMHRLTMEKIFIYFGYGLILTVATIIIRFVWVYLRQGIICLKGKKGFYFRRESLHEAIILSWSGMRGIVSLSAALALPYYLPDGSALPGRDIVTFLTFTVILLSLLIPGLTLSSLMKWLNIQLTQEDQDTKMVRKELLKAAKEEVEHLHTSGQIDQQDYNFLINYFNHRHQMFEIALKAKTRFYSLESARMQVLNKKRQRLLNMWEKNEISDELFNLLERELDVEEVYLARATI